MHRTILTLAALSLLSLVARAQTEERGKRVEIDSATGQRHVYYYVDSSRTEDVRKITDLFTVDPVKFFFLMNTAYYRAVTPAAAVGVGLAVGVWGQTPAPVQVMAEVRAYPSKKYLTGFYIAPNMTYTFNYNGMWNLWGANSGHNFDMMTLGVLLGWQWFAGDAFAYSFALGLDKWFAFPGQDGYDPPLPAMRFTLGYGWQ